MDAAAAFWMRTRDDATLKAELGTLASGYARIQGGWPEDFTDESAFPQITFFQPRDSVIRGPGIREFEVQADIWAWPDPPQGPAKVEAVDERLLALFDEQAWTQGNVRWQGLALPGTDRLAGSGSPIRKMRRFNILGSSLS